MRPIQKNATIHIHPSTLAAHPLSKERIAVYNSGLVAVDRYRRDARFIAATAPESLRIDLGWGAEWMPWSREVVARNEDGSIRYDFDETDRIARMLVAAGARPYWSYCYVPAAVRAPGDDWREMEEDDSTWVRAVVDYVAGMPARGVSVGYHEIYNEPDLRDERTGEATFYAGGLEDYLDLYRATAPAIRAAEPAARIGGPALAVPGDNKDWLDAFLAMVSAENLPLDFLSFHHYGRFGIEAALRNVREALAAFPDLRHVELHLNEYNAYPIDYPRGGLQDGHHLAATFASELSRLLAHREITRTHWAQFLDSGHGNFSGMIDIDGRPKPIYDVYHFYQRMPVDRVLAQVTGPSGIGCLASADGARTTAIVWNRHISDVSAQLSIDRLDGHELAVTVIDESGTRTEHAVATRDGVELALRRGAVALLRAGEPLSERVGRIAWGVPVGIDAAQPGWSDLDEQTATFRFGTAPGGGWLVHGADLLDGRDADSWEVTARTAHGEPAVASVLVHDGTVRLLAGDDGFGWDALPDRPRPHGSRRVFVAVRADEALFVTVAPRRWRSS